MACLCSCCQCCIMICHDVIVRRHPTNNQDNMQQPQVAQAIQGNYDNCKVTERGGDVAITADRYRVGCLKPGTHGLCCCEAFDQVVNASGQLYCQHGTHACEQHHKGPVVFGTNAIVDPFAVMIKPQHTLVALLAVPAASLDKSLHVGGNTHHKASECPEVLGCEPKLLSAVHAAILYGLVAASSAPSAAVAAGQSTLGHAMRRQHWLTAMARQGSDCDDDQVAESLTPTAVSSDRQGSTVVRFRTHTYLTVITVQRAVRAIVCRICTAAGSSSSSMLFRHSQNAGFCSADFLM